MKNIKNVKDLTGEIFGKLTVIGLVQKDSRKTYWYCKCECGNIKQVRSDSLQCGAIKSCGCLKKEQDKINLGRTTHDLSDQKIYKIWQGIKSRCYNKNNNSYCNYGERGIIMCDEWKNDFISFYNWALTSNYAEHLTIERIDVNGNYEPSNCKFADIKEQCNNRRTNIKITIGNKTLTLTQWCEFFEIDYGTVIARYRRNSDISLDELFKAIS